MSALLTDEEMRDLSGLKQGAAQAKFLLRAYGLNVPRRPDGRVRVTWDAINKAVLERGANQSDGGHNWTK